jgi:hypothetical protein
MIATSPTSQNWKGKKKKEKPKKKNKITIIIFSSPKEEMKNPILKTPQLGFFLLSQGL